MINLMSNEYKKDILYARRNRSLLRWVIALVITLIGIGIFTLAGQAYMQQSKRSYVEAIEQTRHELKVQKLEETQKRLADISGNIKLVIQVLSREILFSKLLKQLGSAVPDGVALSRLEINKLQGGLDLFAKSTSFETASQLQLNLQDPNNKLFDKADIETIQCGGGQKNVKYPCDIKIRALFSKDNPFLFINNKQKPGTN